MKPPVPFLLAAAAVFTGAALFFKSRADQPGAPGLSVNSLAQTTGVVLSPTTSAPPAPAHVIPPPQRPAPSAGALMDRVEEKLLATAKPEVLSDLTAWTDDLILDAMQRVAGLSADERAQVKTHLASLRLDRQRNSLRTDLAPAGRIAALAELNRASDAWLAEFLGGERFGKYEASRKAKLRADAESAASRGLNRISRAVPLRPDQKDALYSGFVTAALDPAAPAVDPLTQFQITSSISEEPGRPNIQEEAKTTLSPEQWAQYEAQAKLYSEGQNKMTQHMMGMLPVLLTSLQELMEETDAADKAK